MKETLFLMCRVNPLLPFMITKTSPRRFGGCDSVVHLSLSFQQVRNLDYMCLRLIHGDAPQGIGNFIEYHDNGSIVIRLREYKTAKVYGETNLDLSCFPELTHTIERYMKVRGRLLCGHQHNFFFMRRNGEPFQNSLQFSHYLKHNYKSFSDGAEFTRTSVKSSDKLQLRI